MSDFNDEKLVLSSAFMDQIHWTDDRRCIVSLNYFEVVLDFPLEYPNCPPFFSIHGIPKSKLPADLDQELLSIFVPGQVVAFEWIQYLSSVQVSLSEMKSDILECYAADEDVKVGQLLPAGCPVIHHSLNPLVDKKSVFIAHCAKVLSINEIDLVESYLKTDKKISKATHNITAYRFMDSESQKVREHYDDDGESAAGKRLLLMLQSSECINVYVMVSRWFGGTLLGPQRFKDINQAARSVLEENDFISENKKSKRKD